MDLVIEVAIVRPAQYRAIWCILTCAGAMVKSGGISIKRA
jgi:hypothetical protein